MPYNVLTRETGGARAIKRHERPPTYPKLQMTIDITNQVRIQEHSDYWYTVEDIHLDVGCDGCTISYWEFVKDNGDKRIQHICMGKEEALAVADAIYKLFKKD